MHGRTHARTGSPKTTRNQDNKHTVTLSDRSSNVQDAQLSQRDCAAVIVFPKSRRLELGDNTLRTV